MTNNEIQVTGMKALHKALGLVEAARFVAYIQREPYDFTNGIKALENELGPAGAKSFVATLRKNKFDYTKWQQNLYEGMTLEEFDRQVLATQQRLCGDAPQRKRAAPERELAAAN